MEQEGSFTDAAVRPDPQPAVSSIVRPNPQFVGCTDCPECNQSPLYHDMHGCGLQARDPERLGNQLARDENEDEGDDEGDDAQIDVVGWARNFRWRLWGFDTALAIGSASAGHFCHGLYDDVCTVASQFGFCDRDSSASSGELILTFIFALLWAVQFLCVYWPTVESHVVSDVLAWLTVESHVVSDVLAAENYFTDEDGKVCIEDSSDEEDTTLARKSYIEIGDSSDEEDRKLPGKDLAGSSDSESKRRYLRIDDSSDEEEPAHPVRILFHMLASCPVLSTYELVPSPGKEAQSHTPLRQ
ncbi:hypothetical protein THAOC_05762 [Thalassiosira oceanica]|uniref:Uncharacterized protein n=1 Tax=Thalassiosira oceanica TaxID=159749 RepID=K0TMH4_THAOC|nr:hypothetical protein THAOC_05762 [Thalassiosira oceanica]|eukprot:EJK72682.1 hypothetical protein THAOC_05762 [Thalassiosira oceanica]